MSDALQVSLTLAALAFVVLVLVLIPAVIQLRRQAGEATAAIAEVRGEVTGLAVEVRGALARVNALSGRVEQEWTHIETTARMLRGWAARADAVVSEVDAAVVPPLLGTARAVGLARVGLSAFWDALRRGRRDRDTATSEEGDRDVR